MKKIFTFVCGLLLAVGAMATQVSSVAQYNALAKGDSAIFTCPLVALVAQGKYVLATDGTDNLLVYGTYPACQNGDTLLNVRGLVDIYNNQIELKNPTYTIGGRSAAIAATEVDHAAADNLLTYAKLTNVTASVSNKTITFYLADGTVVAGYNAAGITLPTNPGSTLSYEGFIMLSTNKYQFIPTSWTGNDTPVQVAQVSTVAEYLALADGTTFEFTAPLTVAFVYRIYYTCATYCQDAAGNALQIYEKRAKTTDPYIATYEQGDILPAGWKGIKIDFNGTKEITPLEGFVAPTEKGHIQYTERTVATLCEADVNNVVLVRNVTLSENPEFPKTTKDGEKHRLATDGTTEVFDFYDTFHSNDAATGYILFPDEDGTYDIFGIGKVYYGKYEFAPVTFDGHMAYTDTDETALTESNASANVLKTIENGQVVIIRNGIRYNALGATVE